jgi:hypothetical protein
VQYLAWNDHLTVYFFKPEAARKRVHLAVASSLIEIWANRQTIPAMIDPVRITRRDGERLEECSNG